VNIVACVKQVPDTEAQIKVKPDGSGIDESGIKWVMNPYDEFGVEEALKLKKKWVAMLRSSALDRRERWNRSVPPWQWAPTRAFISMTRL
jgi:hypothetical protein